MSEEYNLIHHIFTPIFNHMGFKQPVGSAAYYVLLIMNFPIKTAPIQGLALKILKTEIKKDQVSSGKEELLKKGFIAEVLLSENTDEDIATKTYLPVNPELILVENQDEIKDYFRDGTSLLENKDLKSLCSTYIDKFKNFGIVTNEGSFTGYFSMQWLKYTFINNMKHNKKLLLMISNVKYPESPLSKYFEGIISKDLKIEALFDDNNEELKKIAQGAKNKKLNVELRYTQTPFATSRRMIFNNMAIDAIKLLDRNEPFYIGTVYLQKEYINYLRSNFESIWKTSEKI